MEEMPELRECDSDGSSSSDDSDGSDRDNVFLESLRWKKEEEEKEENKKIIQKRKKEKKEKKKMKVKRQKEEKKMRVKRKKEQEEKRRMRKQVKDQEQKIKRLQTKKNKDSCNSKQLKILTKKVESLSKMTRAGFQKNEENQHKTMTDVSKIKHAVGGLLLSTEQLKYSQTNALKLLLDIKEIAEASNEERRVEDQLRELQENMPTGKCDY